MGSAGAARRESGADSCWCSWWWGRCPSWWSRRSAAATMTVANLLMPVAGLIKARYRGAKADIDSPFFKLHYRTTATLFFICCLLVTANDLIGSTISCFGPEGVPGGLLNTYCWIMSTFSIPGSGGAHPGLGPETGEETVHAYYQWVPFVLFLQGVMFYIPKSHQVHLPSLRTIRNGEQEGRPLHPRSEHHQREDLRHPLVLAGHPRLHDRRLPDLRRRHHRRARPAQGHGHQEGPGGPRRPGLPSGHQRLHWRLVHDLPCVAEHGFNHVQHLHRGNNREVQDESIG